MRRGKKRPYASEHPPLDLERVRGGSGQCERWGSTWEFRTVTGVKDYTCPGCNRLIPTGVRHVVAFDSGHMFGSAAGVAERRHWHTTCWKQGLRP